MDRPGWLLLTISDTSARGLMPKLKPSGYIPAADTLRPGYLQKRMKVYRELIEEQKRRQDAADAEAQIKVKPLIKVKP